MPQVYVGDRQWSVAPASNLLDTLLEEGIAVPYSCRAGSCHACLVRCVQGEPLDALPLALSADRRQQGWRLACQCRVVEDLRVEVFDPLRDGLPAQVVDHHWLSAQVLRLRVEPARPQRYRAGQHQVLWTACGIARPYSLASVPGEDRFLEYHLDCSQPGAFCDVARQWQVGDTLRLGELRGGALHYDPDWQDQPLLLLAAGTGLGPLWGVLREALQSGHKGPITLLHLAQTPAGHYLSDAMAALAAGHPTLSVQQVTPQTLPGALDAVRPLSRRSMALVCGGPASVETFARRLYLAGLPRSQVLADVFVTR